MSIQVSGCCKRDSTVDNVNSVMTWTVNNRVGVIIVVIAFSFATCIRSSAMVVYLLNKILLILL